MKKIERQGQFAAACCVFSLDSFAGNRSLTLTVLIKGAKASTGQAIASLFSTAENYLKEPLANKMLPINDEG